MHIRRASYGSTPRLNCEVEVVEKASPEARAPRANRRCAVQTVMSLRESDVTDESFAVAFGASPSGDSPVVCELLDVVNEGE